MDNQIQQLEIRDIMEHPQNPRKDLGDLKELIESIRIHGVMQNLIVMEKEELLAGLRSEYEKTPLQILAKTMDRIAEHPGAKYVVLLGHRRLEAASLADLDTVPCIVRHGLTLNDQISLMLLENMQRNNLTIIEEAESFQMMLDLGDTVKTVAEKTGFSQTTVRHRTELAKLDREILKTVIEEAKECGWQITLADLAKLEKIDDIAARDEILQEAGDGDDIEWKVTEYLNEKKKRENRDRILEKIREIRGKELAAPPKGFNAYNGVYNIVLRFPQDGDIDLEDPKTIKTIEKQPDDAFFAETYTEYIIAKKSKKSESMSKQEAERKELDKRKKEVSKLTKAMIKGWIAYLVEIVNGSRTIKTKKLVGLDEDAFNMIERIGLFLGHTGEIALAESMGKEMWNLEEEERAQLWDQYKAAPIGIRMLIHLAAEVKNHTLMDFYGKLDERKAKEVRGVLDLMERAGYQETDANMDLIDGTHELFKREEE